MRLDKDKTLHIAAGMAIFALVVLATGSAGYGALAAIGAGLAKEAYDAAHPAKHTVDPLDAVWTGLIPALFWLGSIWMT